MQIKTLFKNKKKKVLKNQLKIKCFPKELAKISVFIKQGIK